MGRRNSRFAKMIDPASLAARMAELRGDDSMRTVAGRSNLSASYWSKLESASGTIPSEEVLLRIARREAVPFRWLAFGEGELPPQPVRQHERVQRERQNVARMLGQMMGSTLMEDILGYIKADTPPYDMAVQGIQQSMEMSQREAIMFLTEAQIFRRLDFERTEREKGWIREFVELIVDSVIRVLNVPESSLSLSCLSDAGGCSEHVLVTAIARSNLARIVGLGPHELMA